MKRAIAIHAARPRAAMPGLLPDLLRRISAGLRSPKPERKQAAIAALLAARAFAAGLPAVRIHSAPRDGTLSMIITSTGSPATPPVSARPMTPRRAYLRDRLPPVSSARDASTLAPTARRPHGGATPRSERARAISATCALASSQLPLI